MMVNIKKDISKKYTHYFPKKKDLLIYPYYYMDEECISNLILCFLNLNVIQSQQKAV